MNEVEAHAIELVRRGEWLGAAELYDDLVGISLQKGSHKNTLVGFLLGRSECFYELGRHEAAVADCQHILKLLTEAEATNSNGTQAWRRIVYSLFAARRFPEAEAAAREWLIISGGATNQPEAIKMLERIRAAYQTANGQQMNPRQSTMDDEMMTMESRLQSWTGIGPPRQRKHPVELIGEPPSDPSYNKSELTTKPVDLEPVSNNLLCSYCCMKFTEQSDLRAHCQSEAHQRVIMSDEGRDWAWRPPPRGITSDAYATCDAWADNAACRYGNQCVDAHGDLELAEWKERFEYRRMKLQRACEKELFGKAYTEQLLERWVSAPSPDKVMRERLDGVEDSCSADLITAVAAKKSTKEWVFTLVTDRPLRQVALLQDATRNHFSLRLVSSADISRNERAEWTPTNDQEWAVPALSANESLCLEHKLTVDFKTDIYGTFRQSVVFDFGVDPVLVKHLCVDVLPVDNVDKMKKIVKDITLAASERWDQRNSIITMYSAPSTPMAPPAIDGDREQELLTAYPSPRADTFALTQSTVQERRLTRNNYRARMHELLAVEEMARYEQVARYNLTTKLRMADSYLLAPNGMATSTAKYSHSGELFALMTLGKDVSEDTSSGRLILNNCTTVLMAAARKANEADEGENGKRVVYEALIEDKGKNVIYLKVSASAVRALGLSADTDFHSDVQFQLNRVPYCEWHYAIDKIGDFRVIFPETTAEPAIPWTPQKYGTKYVLIDKGNIRNVKTTRMPTAACHFTRQWSEADSRLNLKQKEAVVAITTPVGVCLPPILIIGPFGTGKTFTLAQAIKQLLRQNDTKILICTHSNSAADLYIKDYLHPHVEAGHEAARPLRIYYHKRWVATVNQTVQKYCLIELANGVRTFKIPTVADIEKHRIVVVTLSISMYLATLGLKKGHFTHILLDEAAQAMECEAIMPLALASDSTRIVLAGDHMQLSPELFSQFAKERNLHVSLLERLYDHYPNTFPCKVLLCENYRAHEAIIKFTSELFYDQKLISSGKQPRHDKFYPLTFFTTRGEDVQDINSTAFYNNSEVYEVVERVSELRKRWPPAWGKMDDQAIGIMTPYADQVFRIRSELRKRRMGGISVERVLNVQGKQFRAIFLSTVRTRRTCSSVTKAAPGGDAMDYGFLSNSKLLNTAITRAQSLVAVVGDPIALCSIGRCRKVWERFIEICNENKSLFGITWQSLRSQLDGVELKKTFVLNPLAPEFIPRSYQNEPYIRLPPSILGPVPPAMAPFGGQLPAYNTVYRYPVYPVFYPPAPTGAPQQTIFAPMRAPPGPIIFPAQPSPATTGNPWPVNFPMISPPGPAQNVRTAYFQKKPDVMEAGPRIVGSFPANPSPVGDNYIPGGVISPASFLRGPGFPGPVVRERGDKEQIQFLQNVHFPERRPELASLLPGNANLQDMLESRSRQIEWYTHLNETQGALAANRFMRLLMIGQQRAPSLSPALPQFDGGRSLDEMLAAEKHHSMFHPIQPSQLGSMVPPPGSEMTSPKPLLLRDLEASMMASRAEPRDVWHPPPHESVPLYRRQPVADVQPSRAGSSGAFAGYARAAVSNGFENRSPQQHQQQQQQQQQQQHQYQQHGPSQMQQQQQMSMSQSMSQQMLSQQVNAEFGSEPTYAGALRSSKSDDPLAVLRALGTRSDAQRSGLYQYFS